MIKPKADITKYRLELLAEAKIKDFLTYTSSRSHKIIATLACKLNIFLVCSSSSFTSEYID